LYIKQSKIVELSMLITWHSITSTHTTTTTTTTSVRSSPFFSARVSASAQLSMAAAIMKLPHLGISWGGVLGV
jgi:hypothetical protein